ncbi:protein TIFY 5A-like [Dendrobium catenatum]|uniref:protein TIFY 5A-like n=1 Tax=Dendrobium catenatum TaxID=906689 RepID=UPI0009F21011|nr:protein TIFY 5A-like [Dendrobium catenatum]
MEGSNSFMQLQLSLCSNSDDHRRQQMTIFYDGRVCVSDVTELQAKAILEMAKKELRLDEKQGGGNRQEEINTAALPAPATQLMSPGQSMKRSLQRFLQKRKTRIAESSSPYGFRQPLLQLFSS